MVTVIDKGRRCPKYKCSRLEISSVLYSVTFGDLQSPISMGFVLDGAFLGPSAAA